ncbi:DNA-directed RNA polymerase III subunit RPC9 isoform X3 [Grus americana]|uniref:DNA-directed RNA polymerase III subunit RPC9 isoform X3 n=1 Tax=Grus americana TaxID=9117 RepID=UPI0024077FDA|nr:DNA-directed RNA polymerase III subunit RPC9 isoform X3 [Grus americana]
MEVICLFGQKASWLSLSPALCPHLPCPPVSSHSVLPSAPGEVKQESFAAASRRELFLKDANAALLSNFEVFQLLTDLKQQRKESGKNKQSSGQQNLNTIMYETLKYISKTPCRYQSPETVRDFLIAMKGHKLTKAEKLQLLNHRPVTAVEIQLGGASEQPCGAQPPAGAKPRHVGREKMIHTEISCRHINSLQLMAETRPTEK